MKTEDLSFNLILWKHDPLKNGDLPVWLYACHAKEVIYLSTGFGSSPEFWEPQKQELQMSHPQYGKIIRKFDQLVEEVKFEVKLAERNQEDHVTLKAIKHRITNKGKLQSPTQNQLEQGMPFRPSKVLEFFNIIRDEEEESENPGGADIFDGGKSPVSRFLGGQEKDILFTDFDKKKCQDYEKFLINLKLKETSMSLYLRTFYRVWNIAGDRGHHPNDPKLHPSNFIKFRAYKRIKTAKRAIPISVFKSIAKLKFSYESRFYRTQQYILFSYYARGMNFNDICKLKRSDIVGNNINYTRSKTGKPFCFELHSKALRLISLFRMYPIQSDDDYVFPVLMSCHDTARKIDQRVESALQDVNEDLKEFAIKIKFPGNLTSYVFRHSFATHLEQAGVDIKYIKEALGQETEEQVRIYLSEISDWRVAGAVNKALK